MTWVLLTVGGALSFALLLLVAALIRLVLRLGTRLADLETRLASSDADGRPQAPESPPSGSRDAGDRPEFVITRVGEPVPEAEREPAARVDATLFTDLLLKESVVQAASLAHGLRRALAPETRNRIRFHMRAEVRRSRKQRRAELRDLRREWAARQRTAMAADDRAETAA